MKYLTDQIQLCFLFALVTLNSSDVVETETSLEYASSKIPKLETSKFVDFPENFQKNVVTTIQVEFFSNYSHFSDLFSLFLTCKYNKEKPR